MTLNELANELEIAWRSIHDHRGITLTGMGRNWADGRPRMLIDSIGGIYEFGLSQTIRDGEDRYAGDRGLKVRLMPSPLNSAEGYAIRAEELFRMLILNWEHLAGVYGGIHFRVRAQDVILPCPILETSVTEHRTSGVSPGALQTGTPATSTSG